MVLKQGLITDESLCDEHGQRVVGFGFVWSLLKPKDLEVGCQFLLKRPERHLLRCMLKLLGQAWAVFDYVNVATNA